MPNKYTHTLTAIKNRLPAAFPNAEPIEGAGDDVSHTLWMIEQIRSMDNQGKIDRWVGWIGAKAHSLGIIDRGDNLLTEGRALVAKDLVEDAS
ncbi:MAG: hypothetical protein MUQ65_13865 [Armatimonadetes bacterium]|nr:hypothetical protein [Armatimonadota bacterium]